MGSEKFCLRWNDFESNISLAFRELRDDKDFFDVTIACEDEQINAHKVILSACSPFFRDILRRNPHQHPLLYLKGIKLLDLQSVLNFMYHGEVSVAQEELNTFLAVAEDLKVKGLTQGKSGSGTKVPTNATPKTPAIKPKAQISRDSLKPTWATNPSQSPSLVTQEDDDIQEVVPVKTEPREVPPPDQHQVSSLPMKQIYQPPPQPASLAVTTTDDPPYDYQVEGYDDYGQYEDLHQDYAPHQAGEAAFEGNKDVESLMSKHETGYMCLICHRVSAAKGNMKKHIESVHMLDEPQQCGFCERKFKNKNSLQNHMSLSHRKH